MEQCIKVRKDDKICSAVTLMSSFLGTACSTSAFSVVTTISLAGVAVPLAVLSGLSYVSAVAATAVGKNMSSKRAKHLAIAQLAKSTSLTLSKYVNKIKDEDKIEVGVFDMICKVFEKHYQHRN